MRPEYRADNSDVLVVSNAKVRRKPSILLLPLNLHDLLGKGILFHLFSTYRVIKLSMYKNK